MCTDLLERRWGRGTSVLVHAPTGWKVGATKPSRWITVAAQNLNFRRNGVAIAVVQQAKYDNHIAGRNRTDRKFDCGNSAVSI
ncbi:MAG: hypothetical protein UX09_C0019G0020 [Candidatus Uhrbacteria bacterium GW2011_GWE2_45_35]|uniref:Uncharacterized protein n=2 Tax=Candidatus Uhriibacteriota TaxID=1752732 RepID=A0A0G1MHB3_9BACT|nr:MAG: hypothetical protein UW63_C0018G0019 [Candidatus Uhrbacteria bacterium GW2011_GWF2_44_350]KKU08321.1 MAG: hypothetical protein UX09_C0019G0020 [Candidatus Uhrbacteria bacterium GW2011_GWE2_45_35]